jgi:hypothetical protein
VSIPLWEYHYGTRGISGTFRAVETNDSVVRFGTDVIPKGELAAATGLRVDQVDALIGKRSKMKLSVGGKQRLEIVSETQHKAQPQLGR